MANYCTATEVRDLVPKVVAAKMDDPTVDKKIVYAQSIIDSYMSSIYTVPFTTVPPLIKTICTEMSAHYVLRTLFTRDSVNKSDWVDEFLLRHLNTRHKTGTIYDILNGVVSLITPDGPVVSTNGDLIESNNGDDPSIFNVDGELTQAIPSTRLDDIEDERDVS